MTSAMNSTVPPLPDDIGRVPELVVTIPRSERDIHSKAWYRSSDTSCTGDYLVSFVRKFVGGQSSVDIPSELTLKMSADLYFLAFPNDPLRNKALVYTVFLLEIFQTVSISRSAFYVFVTGYGNFDFYDRVELAWLDVPIISGIVAFLAEGFYAYRISILSDSYWVASVILALAFVQLAGAISAAVVLKEAGLFSQLLGPRFSVAAGIWNGGSAVCDVIIAVCMTYYLSRQKSQLIRRTQLLLTKIIALVIETGTATAAIAILNLILESIPLSGRPSYYQVPSEILAKVYSNSMMVLLNSRMRIGADPSPESGTNVRFIMDPNNSPYLGIQMP
ncbi:hypothetical protein CPB84DRAFT_1842960 [Gymnopilus junonius]|uniref:DUF6534 domain-containing protein n=1 Tax=Gymnopilus junonius TaxID=109634 RepID=A0A9P5NXG4_GYMJU|nr:hypothetical protein CPB84DRAFT_1842960 [Gymnopilus junonius]